VGEKEIQVLKSFAGINANMIVYPDKFVAINGPKKSLVGIYYFEKPYDYETFGIFDLNEFLGLVQHSRDWRANNNRNPTILAHCF